jgi:enhancing lycopene biosynthesis protein 2
MARRVGVVLSGCGVFDGSEIQEAVAILVALDKRGACAICIAPNILQSGVVNHLHRCDDQAPRNVLVESARISRGKIRDIATVKPEDLDALVFPGGYGAVKNLSTFAAEGPACRVNAHVAQLISAMHAAGKPIGLACIAPAIAAAVLGPKGASPLLTIGTDQGTADSLRNMGAQHQNAFPTDIVIDTANQLVSTPCYMSAHGPWEVFQGADKLVEAVLNMIQPRAGVDPRQTASPTTLEARS